MNENEIQSFIRQTENDLRLANEFLAMWKRRAGTPGPSTKPVIATQTPLIVPEGSAPIKNGYGSTRKAMLRAIAMCPPEYTLYDVEKALTEAGNPLKRAKVSQALSRLLKDREIVRIKQGSGRTAAIFGKATP